MNETVGKPNVAGSSPQNAPTQADVIEALKSDLLSVYKAVLALEKRVNESVVLTADVRPQLIALKVHTESFPNALRELRRCDTAVQKSIAEFDARLRNLEARIKGAGANS